MFHYKSGQKVLYIGEYDEECNLKPNQEVVIKEYYDHKDADEPTYRLHGQHQTIVFPHSLFVPFMKVVSVLILALFTSCDIQKEASKQKNDIEFTERIETKEIRKGDTVTYIVPVIRYKDTIIKTISRQGTVLKTYYDTNGNISKSDCIGAEIDLLRNEIRTLNDQSKIKDKVKEESYFDNPMLWLIIALAFIIILKK